MKKINSYITLSLLILMISSCSPEPEPLAIEVYETSANGNQLKKVTEFTTSDSSKSIKLLPNEKFQTITGFGGSFTESTAYLLNQVSKENREKVIEAYFGESGAKYSLTRTHMNSSDFSLSNYSYAPVVGDKTLENFSIEEDKDDIIPMIKEAMATSKDGFKIISSPWTAPPWMKDNKAWKGGKLLPEYYDTWALFFSKYIDAYKAEGIDIWGLTVENEPLGNGSNWESMEYTAQEMNDFVINHLGPKLEADGKSDVVLLGYDQNRDHIQDWADVMYDDEKAAKYFDGMAMHWYRSTYEVFPETLQYTHEKAPNKYLINTEACVDGQVPRWKEDNWYWSKEAKDWGYTWAADENKHLHPPYVPVYRYARDIIGCLNNWVDGWVDWNMVLDKKGGPNWANNWCVAPILVDVENDEVYFTPLYYTLAHFSKFIRPEAVRIGFDSEDENLQVTAAQNPDGSIALIIFNESKIEKHITLTLGNKTTNISINAQAIQTVVIPK